jgi:predicted nuclease of predicted toxin-antitoxin system
MKILLDRGVSPRTAVFLRDLGHDADHIGKRGMPTLADEEIMRLAESEGRVVVTFDLDFTRILALQRRTQPSVVLIRLQQFTTAGINRLLDNLLTTYADKLQAGAILVVDPYRVRVRKLPIW